MQENCIYTTPGDVKKFKSDYYNYLPNECWGPSEVTAHGVQSKKKQSLESYDKLI